MNREEAHLNTNMYMFLGYGLIICILTFILNKSDIMGSSTLENLITIVGVFLLICAGAYYLNILYIRKKWGIIVLIELILGFFITLVGFLITLYIISLLIVNKLMNNWISDHFTLTIIFSTFIFQSLVLLFIKSLSHRYMFFYSKHIERSEEKINISYIRKVQGSSQINKTYSIAVVLVTIIWINTDVPSYLNEFENLFKKPIFILAIAMSVYSNYVVHYFLLENTNDVHNL